MGIVAGYYACCIDIGTGALEKKGASATVPHAMSNRGQEHPEQGNGMTMGFYEVIARVCR